MPIGSSVELLRTGEWQNGWLAHHWSADGTLTAVKVGMPKFMI